jgi:anti-anti-sigma factor
MSPIVFLSVTASRRRLTAFARRGPPTVVVSLRGEHDLTTRSAVAEVMARAITVGDTDVMIDLSRVEFMDAATAGVITCARELLRARSRTLVLRAPSPSARRVLQLCDLSDLVDCRSAPPGPAVSDTAVAPAASGALGALAMVDIDARAEGRPLAI